MTMTLCKLGKKVFNFFGKINAQNFFFNVSISIELW